MHIYNGSTKRIASLKAFNPMISNSFTLLNGISISCLLKQLLASFLFWFIWCYLNDRTNLAEFHIKLCLDYFIYSSIIILVCYVYEKCFLGKNTAKTDLITQLLKSLILSSFGKIIVIPLVIWNPIDIYFNLARLFTCLSNLKALTG